MAYTPSDVCSVSAAYWANYNRIVLANGDTFGFEERQYQVKVMNSRSRVIVVEKATGMGFSEIFILRILHGCIHHRYKQGALYLFPNADEMRKFSKARFGPLIQANRDSIGKYVKSGGKSTDAADIKRIGSSTLYMDGATLSQTVGGDVSQKESAAVRGKQVDIVAYDEWDLMDESLREKGMGRMGNSDTQEEVFISNPTIPGIGIDRLYQQSDQEMWFRKCSHCGTFTCSDEHFPDLIGVDKDGKGYCVCEKCGKALGYQGQWVAKKPENKEIEGYRISHLNSSKQDPWTIYQKYDKLMTEGGNIADFYKLVLGLPYISAEDKLTIQMVMACCGQDGMQTSSNGPCAAGVDIGKIKHVIIGQRTDRARFKVLKVARVSDMHDVHDLFQRFNVKSAVIDIRPYEDEVRQFQKTEGHIRIYLCEYTDNPMHDVVWDDKGKTLKAYRTGAFDGSHRVISRKMIELPRKCPEIDEFAVQICNTAKVLETNKRNGTSVYRYRKLGDEHFRNALNYFLLAASGSKIRTVLPHYLTDKKQEFAIHETVKI